MLRSMHMDTVKVPRSFILDTLTANAAGLDRSDVSGATHIIDVWMPDGDGNVSYEDLVFLLGQRGHGRAAERIMQALGPTASVLRLPCRPGETWLAESLYWPGPVHAAGDLIVGQGVVGGELRVDGTLTYTDLATVEPPRARNVVAAVGSLIRQMPKPAVREAEGHYHIEDLELPAPGEEHIPELGLDYLRSTLSGTASLQERAPAGRLDLDDGPAPR